MTHESSTLLNGKFGLGSAHGKFGELLQGVGPRENSHFLVTLPILQFSLAKFCYSDTYKHYIAYPDHKIKAVALTKKIMDYFCLTNTWGLTIYSQIEEGKGLGSSTADLVACARAIMNALNKPLPMDILLRFLREIEPSDGLMYDGIVCFYHKNVTLCEQLGYLPNLMVVGVDEGGMIDTIRFNQQLMPYATSKKEKYTFLRGELMEAIKTKNFEKIGQISTQSAILNQEINPKKNLEFFINLCKIARALGVIVAHSGTYIGILLDKKRQGYLNKLHLIENELKVRSLKPKKFYTLDEKIYTLFKNPTI